MISSSLKILPPSTQRTLETLGENVRKARLRRALTTARVAERAGISRKTLYQIERGSPAVALGHYAAVLFVLELDGELGAVGAADPLGRTLQDGRMLAAQRNRRSEP
jgi:transcriptional regulator with XRE-family HTH domain